MSEQPTQECPHTDEVEFWRRFIAWWEAKEGKPATARMRDALAYALERRDKAAEDSASEPTIPAPNTRPRYRRRRH